MSDVFQVGGGRLASPRYETPALGETGSDKGSGIILDLPQIVTAPVGHSYIEGDVRQLLEVKNLSLFQKFARLCAGRSVYFWRDSGGLEIDLVVEESGSLQPIEIKAGMTLTPDFFTGLQKWMSLAGNRVVHPTLVYGGTKNVTFKGMRVLGWSSVPTLYPVAE